MFFHILGALRIYTNREHNVAAGTNVFGPSGQITQIIGSLENFCTGLDDFLILSYYGGVSSCIPRQILPSKQRSAPSESCTLKVTITEVDPKGKFQLQPKSFFYSLVANLRKKCQIGKIECIRISAYMQD